MIFRKWLSMVEYGKPSSRPFFSVFCVLSSVQGCGFCMFLWFFWRILFCWFAFVSNTDLVNVKSHRVSLKWNRYTKPLYFCQVYIAQIQPHGKGGWQLVDRLRPSSERSGRESFAPRSSCMAVFGAEVSPHCHEILGGIKRVMSHWLGPHLTAMIGCFSLFLDTMFLVQNRKDFQASYRNSDSSFTSCAYWYVGMSTWTNRCVCGVGCCL